MNYRDMENISKALVKAQSEMSNATKNSRNPFLKNKYADLNAIREAVIPILNQNDIVVLQPMVNIEGKNFIRTMLLHKSGESISSETEIVVSKQNDAQSQGSGITYARRYGLQSLVCIGADDDDGNKASVHIQQQPQRPYFVQTMFEGAKLQNATIQSISQSYIVTDEIAKLYTDFLNGTK